MFIIEVTMRFLLVVFVFAATMAANAQTNRHGQSNGTVTELPTPRVFHDPQPLTETGAAGQNLSMDPKLQIIEAKYEAQLAQLNSQLDQLLPADSRELSSEIMRVKLDRDLAILDLLRERAQSRSDNGAIEAIDREVKSIVSRRAKVQERIQKAATKNDKSPTAFEHRTQNGSRPASGEAGGNK
jgi:hypothetical protein